jgi:hypothetical protein
MEAEPVLDAAQRTVGFRSARHSVVFRVSHVDVRDAAGHDRLTYLDARGAPVVLLCWEPPRGHRVRFTGATHSGDFFVTGAAWLAVRDFLDACVDRPRRRRTEPAADASVTIFNPLRAPHRPW